MYQLADIDNREIVCSMEDVQDSLGTFLDKLFSEELVIH